MGAVLVVFIVCLIGKDVAFAPFPYVLRGGAQALCFAVGLGSLLPLLSPRLLSRYWPIIGYLLILLLVAPTTEFPTFVLLQVMSLMSAVVFSIAYFEKQQIAGALNLNTLLLCTVLTYGLVACASLAMIKFQPSLVYDSMFVGEETGYERRFRGLLSRSGVMGAASGILVGLAAISITSRVLKCLFVIPALTCLALTQSRSFWLAAFCSGGVTAWIYYPSLRNWIYACLGGGVLLAAVVIAFGITVDTSGVHAFARLDSVSDLTGRTELWQTAYKAWSAKPWLGYGFTLGGMGLAGDRPISTDADPTQYSRLTLHNGYVQSLMDSGMIGFFFYVMTILISIVCVVRYDSKRRFPAALYVLLFLAIANGGESVIYSGSVFQSLCFWIFAVFAMSLPPLEGKQGRVAESETCRVPAKPARPANLLE